MKAKIEQRVATTINEMTHSGGLPQVQVHPIISSSAHKSSCASKEVPEEQREIEGVQVDDSQWYPVDDLCRCTPCELHKTFCNITIKVLFMLLAQQLMHDLELIPSLFLYIYIGGGWKCFCAFS
jgi:hypothetical protein